MYPLHFYNASHVPAIELPLVIGSIIWNKLEHMYGWKHTLEKQDNYNLSFLGKNVDRHTSPIQMQ